MCTVGGREQSWVAEAQLGCSGEVQGQVGFAVAFPIPAPFCLKHTRCPCVLPHVPVPCSVSQPRDKRHLPGPAGALMHHLYKYHPRPGIKPLGVFVLAFSLFVCPKQSVPESRLAKPALPRAGPASSPQAWDAGGSGAGLGLCPHFIVLRVWAPCVPQPM